MHFYSYRLGSSGTQLHLGPTPSLHSVAEMQRYCGGTPLLSSLPCWCCRLATSVATSEACERRAESCLSGETAIWYTGLSGGRTLAAAGVAILEKQTCSENASSHN